jgi:hypothetical protein
MKITNRVRVLLTPQEIEIVEAIENGLKDKEFGLIKLRIEIEPMGYMIDQESKQTTEITLEGNPEEIDIMFIQIPAR